MQRHHAHIDKHEAEIFRTRLATGNQAFNFSDTLGALWF